MHCQKQYGSSLAILYNLEMVQKLGRVVADRYCTFISPTKIECVQIIIKCFINFSPGYNNTIGIWIGRFDATLNSQVGNPHESMI